MATTQEVEQQLRDRASQALAGGQRPAQQPPKPAVTPPVTAPKAGAGKPAPKPAQKPPMQVPEAARSAMGFGTVPQGIMDDMQGIIKERDRQLAETPLPEKPLGQFTQPQTEHLSAFSSMLMVMGAMAGRRTMAPATAALNNISGIMQGMHEGNLEAYNKNKSEFEANYKRAVDNYNDVVARRKEIMDISKGDLAVKDKMMHDFFLEQGIEAKFQKNQIDYTNGLNNMKAKMDEHKVQFDRIMANVVNPQIKPTPAKTSDVTRLNIERDKELAKSPKNAAEINARFDKQIAALGGASAAPAAPAAAPSAPSGKPTPSQADIDYVKAHPETKSAFVAHFGIEP